MTIKNKAWPAGPASTPRKGLKTKPRVSEASPWVTKVSCPTPTGLQTAGGERPRSMYEAPLGFETGWHRIPGVALRLPRALSYNPIGVPESNCCEAPGDRRTNVAQQGR